jgi:hypothetical protein
MSEAPASLFSPHMALAWLLQTGLTPLPSERVLPELHVSYAALSALNFPKMLV